MSDGHPAGETSTLRPPTDFTLQSFRIDLAKPHVVHDVVQCEDHEDAFGGIARGFKLLADYPVDDAYDPAATLVMNLGILSGTDYMTGLRTYFHGYSPLKRSSTGKPSAMWSAGSGKFGTKLRTLGIDEVFFTGRFTKPTILRIHRAEEGAPPEFEMLDGSALVGLHTNAKIQTLYGWFPEAHFAVIGPAGENYLHNRMAAIALSTVNQLKSGDPKPRFCGRGGFGGVMGSKNLLAVVADTPDGKATKAPAELKPINLEVARGKGSARFRDRKKNNGGGGTWANYEALAPVHALPEMNFQPAGDDRSFHLTRPAVEETGQFVIKDESCFRCGISCHKNVYDPDENGKAGKFRAKLDFEPLDLLASNIGVFDIDKSCTLVELVDEMCMDSISCGVTLAYAMEYNKRHPDTPIAEGLSYGDAEKAMEIVEKMGTGQLAELGQGTLRCSEQTGDTGYAMHVKGVELPAYLPQTNPGYAWALAGGHMSMRTYLLCLYEKETGMDYWVDAITNRGLSILRDDFLGGCKFAGIPNDMITEAVQALSGLDVSVEVVERTIRRTFLRGYLLERKQGFTESDYSIPDEAHDENPHIQLPYFNTREFFAELREKVTARFEKMLVEEGLVA